MRKEMGFDWIPAELNKTKTRHLSDYKQNKKRRKNRIRNKIARKSRQINRGMK